jgi:hypothetical protein
MACQAALLNLSETPEGQSALQLLFLDGVVPVEESLFAGIAARMAAIGG